MRSRIASNRSWFRVLPRGFLLSCRAAFDSMFAVIGADKKMNNMIKNSLILMPLSLNEKKTIDAIRMAPIPSVDD